MPRSETVGRGTWIDKLSSELLQRERRLGRPLDVIRVESGLGASGIPHIGSLGDAVRAYGIKLSLEDQGYDAELIAYSDDLDGLRKVPHGFPQSLREHLAKPVSMIPDPFGEYDSYGSRMSSLLLEGLDSIGVRYRFQSARDAYARGLFEEQIHTILSSSGRIGKKISEMVGQEKFLSRLPYFPVCGRCGKIYTTSATGYDPDGRTVSYRCRDAAAGAVPVAGCGYDGVAGIRDPGKLAWKVEFAARWQALDVRFEAYGKDIMDSVRINDWVSDHVLGFPHPHHVRYEMFLDRGGKKISKSSGNVVTPQQWLRYGAPESVLLLLYKRISGARAVSLEDIPYLMDEYGSLERAYFAKGSGGGEKAVRSRGLYQYVNLLKPPAAPAPRVSYRLLVELCRIFREGRRERVAGKLVEYGMLREPHPAVDAMIDLAGNYADDFGSPAEAEVDLDMDTRRALSALADVLDAPGDPEDLQGAIFDAARTGNVPPRKLFSALYQIILGTSRGPRLGPFIDDMGRRRVGRIVRERISN